MQKMSPQELAFIRRQSSNLFVGKGKQLKTATANAKRFSASVKATTNKMRTAFGLQTKSRAVVRARKPKLAATTAVVVAAETVAAETK